MTVMRFIEEKIGHAVCYDKKDLDEAAMPEKEFIASLFKKLHNIELPSGAIVPSENLIFWHEDNHKFKVTFWRSRVG